MKRKGSLKAKLAAWIGMIISGAFFFLSIAGAAIIYEADVYAYTKEEYCQALYERAADTYADMVFDDLDHPSNDKFLDTNYRYGVIQSETLDWLNLNEDSTYIERNFTQTVTEKDLYVRYYEVVEGESYSMDGMLSDSDDTLDAYERYVDYLEEEYYDGYDMDETSGCYIVVAILPQEVNFGYSSDLFEQANTIVTIAYGLRYSIYFIILISFLVCIALLGYLISAAGRRRGTEEIVECWMDKIPFDIYMGLVVSVEYILLSIWIDVIDYLGAQIILFSMAAMFLLLLIGVLAVLFILSFAVRVKKGKWWRNTVIFLILSLIRKAVRSFLEYASFLWKAIFFMGALMFAEVILIVVSHNNYYIPPSVWAGWFLEKVILTILVLWVILQMIKLQEGGRKLAEGDLSYKVDTGKMFWEFKKHGDHLNSIGKGMSYAVEERLKSERFKTELITNVSHDIKTPLTSMINYVDLLEKEELKNEKEKEYLEVLKRQSARLKKLIEDLIEASKASTGNLPVNMERLEAGIFLVQTVGEFEEKMKDRGLDLRITKPEQPVYIMADSRHFWRVIDNLMNNICKYAQPQTRVYINMEEKEQKVIMIFRNTSHSELNISSEELMERFVRGDSSRNTEGSGLGLSIAKSLIELMQGALVLQIDGDLFKVSLIFDKVPQP